ncbi:unnamed protein product [Coregonus sp. 'balchen']|nr:unnamed protein product [Coregonus sp. 'balchen']
MAHQHPPLELSEWTAVPGGDPDSDSDRDSGVGEDAGEDAGSHHGNDISHRQDGVGERGGEEEGEGDFTIFVAFQGNMDDEDFQEKLDNILNRMPSMLELDSERLQPQHVEPWNSVRVTFNIPREAAERLRLLAQNNQQQLRDLGILSVQIEGEGAINVAMGHNRGQEVRVNGPIGAPGQMRMDVGFPGQPGPVPSSSGQMHPRPPSQTDAMDPMMSLQQQQQLQHPQAGLHSQGPMPPQAAHHIQVMQTGRQLNPAALQQLQQAQQQAQLSQLGGPRPPFHPSGQMPVPSGWNQLPSGVLQPPPAQGGPMGPAWRKAPPQAQMGQRPPSLATVQTPSHPPPPYPFGSQQAGQVFNAMGQLQQQQQPGAGQFAAPQPKGLQGGPGGVAGLPRPPPPLPPSAGPQGNLTAKSPGSSSSPFQQGSPGTPPMMGQAQLGPRPTTPQGFPQGVGSPGRVVLGQQGNMQQGFMGMPQHGQPGPQVHQGGMGGMPKRLPMGFPSVSGNQNFAQGQVTSAPGTPGGGPTPQLQSSQAMAHTGAQSSASIPNTMQGPSHSQPKVMGLHSGMAGQPQGTNSGPSMSQPQPGLQSQMMDLQGQPVSSSPSQMVQGGGPGQTVLSRPLNPGQRGGMTPPKQLMPQQGQGVMHGQGQMVGGPGHQAMLLQQQQQQNSMMEQMQQMQGNKQAFGLKGQAGGQQQGIMGIGGPQHMQVGNGHFPGHGMNFNPQFGGQMAMGGPCAQAGGFPVNKDVTLTSPLLVNLLQSDISASQFGPGGKQGTGGPGQAKPKKKKPPRKKKPKGSGCWDWPGGPRTARAEWGTGSGHGPLRTQTLRLHQQACRYAQQMLMIMKMQQEQAKSRMPLPPGGQYAPRGMVNPGEAQRMPGSQQGNMPVMINLQGHGGVPPSPDKPRGMPLMVNPQMAGAARRMSHPEAGQGPQCTGAEEAPGAANSLQDRPGGQEMGMPPGNGAQQMVVNQGPNTHMMKQGPGPSPQHPGASPQQQMPPQPQQGGPMPGLHFPNVPTTSQSSRPKTPNRASPRPYHHPLTPTNRPPSTEPSEINLSPERLNASIAGLFPPKINIPLPPRQPNLSRGFDQQGGLNPTTLKAIGQAPPSLTLPSNNGSGGGNSNNGQQSFPTGSGAANTGQGKPDKQSGGGQAKRASPSNSRRSSPASSRKVTNPSPGRQKGTKITLPSPSHQQQMVNPQTGQTMMLSPTLVPSRPVSLPPAAGVGLEPQQIQTPFQGMQGNPAEMPREGQGMAGVEHRQMPQPLRELSAPRMASPRVGTPQEAKAGLEQTVVTGERQPVQSTPQQGSGSEASPALRDAPTSLNQLLDNTATPSVPPRPTQSAPAGDAACKESTKASIVSENPSSFFQSSDVGATTVATTAAVNEPEAKPKPSSTPSPKLPNPVGSPNLQRNANTNLNANPGPSPNLNPTDSPNLNSNSSSSIKPSTPNVNPTTTTGPTLNPTPILSVSVGASVSHSSPLPNVIPSPKPNPNPAVSPKPTPSPKPNPNPAVSPKPTPSPKPNPNPAVGPKPTPSPKPPTNVPTVLQIPSSSATISPNQISYTSAPAPTPQAPATVVSAMVAMPNKNIRPQQTNQQTRGPRPPFITTPVFINTGTAIFQVPTSSVAPNTTVVSQPVTMVKPIQVSTTNIQLTTAPTQAQAPASTQAAVVSVASSQPARTLVGQVQMATRRASPVPVSTLPRPQQQSPGTPKSETPGEAPPGQKSSPSPRPSPSPTALASASSPVQQPLASPPCSSLGAPTSTRKSPMSPTSASQGKPAQAPGSAPVGNPPDSQQFAEARSAQPLEGTSHPQRGPNWAVPPHAFPPPPASVTQTQATVSGAQTRTTAAAVPLKVTTPPVSAPTPVPAQPAAPAQSPVPASTPTTPPPVSVPVTTPTPTTAPVTSVPAPPSASVPVPSLSPSTSPVAATPGPSNPPGDSPAISSPVAPTPMGAQPAPTAMEPPSQPAPPEPPAPADNTPVSVQPEPPQQEEPAATEKTAEEVATVTEQGWAKKRKTPVNLVPRAAVEKPKGPSRRSSRAEKEVEEETVADSVQRKRPARPGASAVVAAKETGASPTQAKRRKSK